MSIALMLGRPNALMLIEARTQYLAFTVSQAESASMPRLTDVSLHVHGTGEHRCLSGIVEPPLKSHVRYRLIDDTLLVDIVPSESATTQLRVGRGVQRLSGPVTLTIGPTSRCLPPDAVVRPIRLPVHGEATIGRAPSRPENTDDPVAAFQGLLLDGSVNVFGRPVMRSDQLYPAGTFDLSGGTIVSTPLDSPTHGLYGHVLFEPGDRSPGRFATLSVSGSAVTPYLSVARTTLEGASGTEDKIVAALLASFFRDPLLLTVQVIFALFVTFLNLSLTGFAARRT